MQIVITGDVPIIYSVHCLYVYMYMYTVHVYLCTQFIQYTTVPVKRNLHFKQESQEILYAKNAVYNVRWRVIVCYEVAWSCNPTCINKNACCMIACVRDVCIAHGRYKV